MLIRVQVKPDCHREVFEEFKKGEFRVQVKEPAAGNMANSRVQMLIAEHFNVPVTSVRFRTGMRSHKKTFEVVQ